MISIAFGALFLALSSIPAGLAMAGRPPAATYLALGDSLAVGIGAAPLEDQFGYVGRLSHYLQNGRDGPLVLTNLAVSGETSSTFITGGQLASAVSAIADTDTDVQVVTLEIGGNDLLALLRPKAPCHADPTGPGCQAAVAGVIEGFSLNYQVILGSVADALGHDAGTETIVVMAYYNPFDGTGSPYELPVDVALLGTDLKVDCGALADPARRAHVGMNDLTICMGATFGARIADAYPAFDGNAVGLTHIGAGDIHPNNDGYTVITNAFIRAMECVRQPWLLRSLREAS